MATTNYTGTTVTSGVPTVNQQGSWQAGSKVYVIKNTVDLTGGALVDDDVYQVLGIPANTLVLTVSMRIDTAAVGTTCTLDVGDGDGSNSWDDAVDGKATALTYTHAVVGTDAYASATVSPGGKFYGTSDTVDVTAEAITAITAGPKFTLWAVCVDLS
jgi:hypothetical protein